MTNIAKVQFWANRSLITEVTEPPYHFEWTNVPGGTHFLKARARITSYNVCYTKLLR